MIFRIGSMISIAILGFPAWASTSITGVENFHEIDQKVYRGAQPTEEGIQSLAQLGVKVVLDLRAHDRRSAEEERMVEAAGMRYVNVPMTGMKPPTEAETSTVLALLEDPAAGPVFVHCKRGADRTGAVIAAYRVDHDRWDNTQALNEAMSDGMSSFQHRRQKFISTFQGQSSLATDAAVVGR